MEKLGSKAVIVGFWGNTIAGKWLRPLGETRRGGLTQQGSCGPLVVDKNINCRSFWSPADWDRYLRIGFWKEVGSFE